MENKFWFSSIKIDYSDYPKNLFIRINEVYVFFSIKYRYSSILLKNQTSFKPIVLLQSNFLLCKQGFCDASVMLYNVTVTLPPALSK